MKVKLAHAYGFCGNNGLFGVSGAILHAREAAAKNPGQVYLVGELVHNTHVTHDLQVKDGVKIVKSLTEIPAGATVIVKAQGETPTFFSEAKARGLEIVDATCIMVAAAQKMVRELAAGGKKIIYVASDKNHDEAKSTCGQVDHGVTLVTTEELDDLQIDEPENSVLITQTTLSTLDIGEALAKLKERYPTLTIVPHICDATTKRQQAVIDLAKEVEVIVVVGAPHSSNSNRLKEVAEKSGALAYIVDNETELKKEWFAGKKMVGVTAGASTPNDVLEAVIKKLETY